MIFSTEEELMEKENQEEIIELEDNLEKEEVVEKKKVLWKMFK